MVRGVKRQPVAITASKAAATTVARNFDAERAATGAGARLCVGRGVVSDRLASMLAVGSRWRQVLGANSYWQGSKLTMRIANHDPLNSADWAVSTGCSLWFRGPNCLVSRHDPSIAVHLLDSTQPAPQRHHLTPFCSDGWKRCQEPIRTGLARFFRLAVCESVPDTFSFAVRRLKPLELCDIFCFSHSSNSVRPGSRGCHADLAGHRPARR